MRDSIDRGHQKGLMPQYDMQMEESIDRGHQESMMPQYDMQSDNIRILQRTPGYIKSRCPL
jgi:hypothetical protein